MLSFNNALSLILMIQLTVAVTGSYSVTKRGQEDDRFFLWKLLDRGKSMFNKRQSYAGSQRKEESAPAPGFRWGDEPEHRHLPFEVANPIVDTGGVFDSPSYPEDNGQDVGEAGGSGWHRTKTHVIVHDNMELYSLLGGLSFASLLATAVLLLARRGNGTVLRSMGHSHGGHGHAQEIYLHPPDYDQHHHQGHASSDGYNLVLKLPKFMKRIGKSLTRPLWWTGEYEDR